MSQLEVIRAVLERTASRRRLERILRGLWNGLAVGAALCLATLVLCKLLPVPPGLLAAGGLAGLLLALVAAVWAGWRRVPLEEMARWVDARQHLQERLSTSLELAASPGAAGPWRDLVIGDAATHAGDLDAHRLLPLHLPRSARYTLLTLTLAAGLGLVPEYRTQTVLQRQRDVANIRDAGRHVEQVARRILQAQPPAFDSTRGSLEQTVEAAHKLSVLPPTRQEALRELANAAESLSRQARELARNPALRALERSAREGGAASKSPAALQEQMDGLAKALGKSANAPEALDKLREGLEQARQSAATLPDPSSAAGQAARAQLAQTLNELSRQAGDLDASLEGLDQAMAALAANQLDQVVKDLDAALQDLDKLADMARTLQRLQQAAAKLGKDLAEQLALGQATAAKQTLERMVALLRESGLGRPQLERIMDEVARAVEPAGPYGQVREFLKEALVEMRADRNASAAEALAKAARELEQLLEQLGEAQSLASLLSALNAAQMAIATGQSWGQCMTPGQCPYCNGRGCPACRGTRWGHGGGLGAGVGTWADENSWVRPPDEQFAVDNSGVVRPDLDPRGVSERDAAQVTADRFKAAKTRGQLTPGAPMPSLPLKGVAIKGQSTVQFEEAATAAQAEAQSALNQDQVPRAYQSAVRHYFDDLKSRP